MIQESCNQRGRSNLAFQVLSLPLPLSAGSTLQRVKGGRSRRIAPVRHFFSSSSSSLLLAANQSNERPAHLLLSACVRHCCWWLFSLANVAKQSRGDIFVSTITAAAATVAATLACLRCAQAPRCGPRGGPSSVRRRLSGRACLTHWKRFELELF